MKRREEWRRKESGNAARLRKEERKLEKEIEKEREEGRKREGKGKETKEREE